MRRVHRIASFNRSELGQAIYQTMLAVSCVALGLAIFFPTFEYIKLYHGPVKPHKFKSSTGYAPPAPEATEAAPATEPAAVPESETSTEGETKPAESGEGEAPKPVEEKESEETPSA